VTNERFGVLSLAVSPRGERIAYTRPSAAGEINIYSARGRDGKSRRKLTSIPASRGFANSPTFSANGRLIAYEMADPVSGRSARLMVMRSNGRGKRVLARVPGFYLEDPAFSPNGRRVAYTVVLDFDVANRQIETARVSDGKGRRLVVAEQAADDKSFVQPDYSPNGEKIAFISNPDFLLDRNLLMNTAAAGRAPLRQLNESAIDFDYSHPVYSPDGRRILMVQTSRLFDVPSELIRVNRDGSGLSLVLRANLLDYPIWVRR
jgi:Tol biopolymer transport system component